MFAVQHKSNNKRLKKLAQRFELMQYAPLNFLRERGNDAFLLLFYLLLFQPNGGGIEVSARKAKPNS